MKQTGKTEWTRIRAKLEKCSSKELIELIGELHKVSEDSRDFLEGRLSPSKKSLNRYRKRLCQALEADPIYDKEINFQKADKILKDYRLATGDPEGLAELHVTYVEIGNQFTLDYGDIDEGYYDSMEMAYESAVKHLLLMRKTEQDISGFQDRLRQVALSTSGIGWGYHDALCDIYFEAFGKLPTG